MPPNTPAQSLSSALRAAPPLLPEGYLPIALFPATADAPNPLRLNVIVRKISDPIAGYFVTLKTLMDAVVYLGCITDAGGHLHGYVEIWVQTLDGLANSPAAARETLSNKTLDDRWARIYQMYDGFDNACADTLFRTGFETIHPAPLLYDPRKLAMIHPSANNLPLTLCMNDQLLTSAGLPPYSGSLHRYLATPEGPFVPVTLDAPTSDVTRSIEEVAPACIAFSLGGLFLVRQYAPASLEAFFDLLSGGPWSGILSGRAAVHLDRMNETLEEKETAAATMADGRLFLGKHGKWGRLVETFHLKLRLLSDCLSSVRSVTAQTQRPVLNLSADSFNVALDSVPGDSAISSGLPFLWSSRATLSDPGEAVTLKMEGTDLQYVLRAAYPTSNVYQPQSLHKPTSGKGSLRIRKVMAEPDIGAIIEATFTTQDRFGDGTGPGKNDLVWLRVPLGTAGGAKGGRIDLYGRVEKEPALAAGEWRFRSERTRLPEATLTQLKAAEGLPITEVPFDTLPVQTSPMDLYAMAILGARALLVSKETTLAIVADELLSLARELATRYDENVKLAERIRTLFESDVRWVAALGPQHLTLEPLSVGEALDLVPADIWFETLAWLVRMLPGMGPDSICKDFGDAPRGGLHRIFDPAKKHLDGLLVRSRSLVVIDWRFNREIHSVLRRFSSNAS